MKRNFFKVSFAVVSCIFASGCAGHAQTSTANAESFFAYQSVNLLNTYIGIGYDDTEKVGYITLSDAIIEGESGIKGEYYFATSEQLGLHFAYPVEGADVSAQWRFEDCSYTITRQIEHVLVSQGPGSLQLVEAKCEDFEGINQFVYSTSEGLLSIAFGKLDADKSFELIQGYFLMGETRGFGSK